MARFFLAFLLLLVAIPTAAQPLQGGPNNIASTLVAESPSSAPGAAVTLAFSFTPQPGWHGYWLNPGDAGQPLRVEWSLPPGVTAGPLRFPVPQTLTIAGLMNYVFEGPHAVLTELRLAPGIAPGTRLPVRARIDYLACTDRICVPERAELALDLTAGDGAIDPAQRARFDAWRTALPRALGSEGTFAVEGSRLRIALPLPADTALTQAYLFPAESGTLVHAAPQTVSRNGDALIVETDAAAGAGQRETLAGLLRIGDGQGLAFTARPGPVPAAGTPLGPQGDAATLVLALLGAILGGLILNVMPCVFPILSLKALSLARAGGDARAARREALAYAAGIIVTCLILGGILLALRAGGAAAGWAFQLQEPRVVLLLLLLVTAITLNLAGLFRLPGLSVDSKGGAPSAFATGALAAFVATPCTGPFMAAAFGATLALPAVGALIVFGGLGLGLALPFLLLAFIPALRRLLPRPGPWMVRLQRLLAIPMALTALALLWVLWRQTGAGGLALGLGGAVLLALALALPRRHRLATLALAAAALILPAVFLTPAAPRLATQNLAAQPFSESRLAQLRAEGRPVFLYFTADWCLTCKVNEHGAMADQAVADAFAVGNVAVLEGDWTMGDAAIGRFLERHGRLGVPLYLYYPPGQEPRLLPQLLDAAELSALPG